MVGEPHLRARVERVDGHLRVGGTGDLRAPVPQPGCRVGDLPGVVLADRLGLGEEVEGAADRELVVPRLAQLEEGEPSFVELAVQRAEEVDGLGGEDLGEPALGGTSDLDSCRQVHRASRGCRSVEFPSDGNLLLYFGRL